MKNFLLLILFISLSATQAQTTEILYLSGKDGEHTVNWDFYCTGGRQSGYWTKIPVPSHWEQHGFGRYDYGRDYRTYGKNFRFADEEGLYKHSFLVPEEWRDKKVNIVFEGSMTDTEVKINGQLAGPEHQGAFYRFRYDISDKLKFGERNELDVKVSKMSSNPSVNRAERYADYWIFGGIFRPVYLEVLPLEHIRQVAINAESNGDFELRADLSELSGKTTVKVEILGSTSEVIGTKEVKVSDPGVSLMLKVNNILPWTSETATLYKAKVSLLSGRNTLHQVTEKFGFRTIEIREGDGVYLNGTKIKFKGINRHCFWPETGRSLSPAIDLKDAQLIREMNMNAVRCSHYPPDKSFLDICDSLGIYVLDELAGWQIAYDTEVGEKLVKEMVERDVNHPSVIFWSNGNEGGTNPELDDDYGKYDPSARPVVHCHHRPGNDFNGIDTNHYESYESSKNILEGGLIYMPTEFLHGQDDGGMAASLRDYWELMWSSDRSAGGFLWAMLDEGIVRTDMDNMIDVNRLNAPDGVLGPHREKEGSFNAIKEIYSPVVIRRELNERYEFKIENRYHFTNLNQCKFRWRLVRFTDPGQWQNGYTIENEGILNGPDVDPGRSGSLRLDIEEFTGGQDALLLTAFNPNGDEVYTWSWKIKSNEEILRRFMKITPDSVKVMEDEGSVTLTSGEISVSISKKNGEISGLKNEKSLTLLLDDGPRATEGKTLFKELTHYPENNTHVVESKYEGSLKNVKWTMFGGGWISMEYTYEAGGETLFPGITFTYPESNIISAKWLGNGPYRVWKNRMQGVSQNVWENLYNDTQTGYFPWKYPEFKGYFSDITWIRINTSEGAFLVGAKEENLFVRLFDFTGISGPDKYYPQLPQGNLSFLDGIPPIGTKLATGINETAKDLGPSSLPNKLTGPVTRTLYFYFGLPE